MREEDDFDDDVNDHSLIIKIDGTTKDGAREVMQDTVRSVGTQK